MDLVAQLMAYEQGELNQDEVVTLFQYLLDTSMVWQLQGSYQRTVMELIEIGAVHTR